MPDRLRKTPSAALDDLGVPREDPDGCPFSLYGRIRWLAPTLARVRELRSLADQHAHESGLYARRMTQAQSARDEAKARVRELEAQLDHWRRSAEMACRAPPEGCDCCGCAAADAHHSREETSDA
jgi:hypothetical protein